ncbi:hypothetical protein F5879DRAFT_157590 [Lentinula edodes]|nr:hypothetical protein F5879DRAFT_157590 [Lentinula edodes]
MPLFLSKVFGRKKHEDKASTSSKSSASPLEGKFEYVIPSPSLEKGPDYPHLSLNLPERRENRVLSHVFENGDAVGRTRLSPEQALEIVRSCSQVIITRGLETLGIMHPHWHSASSATQQRLILLFIQSPAAVFESEVNSTRSAHDVAAVFRWAIRHLELPGASFGNDPTWYHNFFKAEKSASYPLNSFTEMLAPQLPAINLELLTTTLNLFSSLAAHSEANSISGSKLSKFLGLWLLTAERSTPGDDFLAFYHKWDKHGRILEHLFLSHIRNEIAHHRMPKRLVELVKHYPYAGITQSSTEHDLLPRPRFSTRRYDALFVHIDTESPLSGPKALRHSLQMVADALNAITPSTDTPPYSIWREVQQTAAAGDEELLYSPSVGRFPAVGRVLSDETLGILSLLADDEIQRESSINFVSRTNSPKEDTDRNGPGQRSTSTSIHARQLSVSSSDTAMPQRPSFNNLGLNLDWNSFSSSGFSQSSPLLTPLAETLLESKDSEVTSPSVTPSRKGSKKSVKTPPHQSRRSLDVLPPITIPTTPGTWSQLQNDLTTTSGITAKTSSRVTKVELIPLDEGFIDFWNDSLLDPITDVEAWPKFVVCRLKTSIGTQAKKVEWIVVEQQYIKPAPKILSVARSPTSHSTDTSAHETTVESTSSPKSPAMRASSPRPSLSSVNASVKRFSFWGGSKKDKGEKEDLSPTTKKKVKGVKIGEMGEILAQEEPKSPKVASPPKKVVEVPAVVEEEQEVQETKKDLVVAHAKAEIGSESIVSPGVAVAFTGIGAAGVSADIAELAVEVQQKVPHPDMEEQQKNLIPAAMQAFNELKEEQEIGSSTPVAVPPPQESSTVKEFSSTIQTDPRAAFDGSTSPELLPQVVASSVVESAPAVEAIEADADVPVELAIDEPAPQVQKETTLEEVAEQIPDVQELESVVDVPVDEIVEDEPVTLETVTEPTDVQEPVTNVSASDASQSIPEPAQFVKEPAVAPIFVIEPTTTDEPEPMTEETVVNDSWASARSIHEPIVQEIAEETAEATLVEEPEHARDVSSPQEPISTTVEDAPEPASPEETMPASRAESVLVQEQIDGPQAESQLPPEAAVEEVEDGPASAIASMNLESGSADLVVERFGNIKPAEELPVVNEAPAQEAEIITPSTDDLEDSQALALSEASTTIFSSELDPPPPAPIESTLVDLVDASAVSVEATEPATHIAERVHEISLPEDTAPETEDNIPVAVEQSNDASNTQLPEMEAASEVVVSPPAFETSLPEPSQEVPESAENVKIKPQEPDTSVEPSNKHAPDLMPSIPVESATSVNPTSEHAKTVNEDAIARENSEPAEDVVEVHEQPATIDDVEAEQNESLVRSEPLRESSPGLENDTVSLSEVPVVNAPVIPPASPSAHPVVIDTHPEELKGNVPEDISDDDISDDLPDKYLSPAPATVVFAGETVGPALALNSSEIVTAALAGEAGDVDGKGEAVGEEIGADDADDVKESEVGNGTRSYEAMHDEVETATPTKREPGDALPST